MVFQEQDRHCPLHTKGRQSLYIWSSGFRRTNCPHRAGSTGPLSPPRRHRRPLFRIQTPSQHLPAPSTPARGPKLPLPPLSVPFSFNVGREVGKDPPALESETSKPERLLHTWPSLLPQLFSSLSASGLVLPRVRVTYGASGEEQGPTHTLRPNNVCHPAWPKPKPQASDRTLRAFPWRREGAGQADGEVLTQLFSSTGSSWLPSSHISITLEMTKPRLPSGSGILFMSKWNFLWYLSHAKEYRQPKSVSSQNYNLNASGLEVHMSVGDLVFQFPLTFHN